LFFIKRAANIEKIENVKPKTRITGNIKFLKTSLLLYTKTKTKNNDKYKTEFSNEFCKLTPKTTDIREIEIKTKNKNDNFFGNITFCVLFEINCGINIKNGNTKINKYATCLPLLIPKPSSKKTVKRKIKNIDFKYRSMKLVYTISLKLNNLSKH
jgi:hypothetical protein